MPSKPQKMQKNKKTAVQRAPPTPDPDAPAKMTLNDLYDAITDLGSPFALQLVDAYPDAKVVIVQRDVEAGWLSFKTEVLDRVMLQPAAAINGFLELYLMGMPAVQAMRKIHFGFFGAQCRDDILVNAR
ncbi:hypothetical protein N7486_000380 [Penicillium sp. IBT 16267x]|nr:hypothetical protein N7486_000380 [Penicillium sp. IBT 16267x]